MPCRSCQMQAVVSQISSYTWAMQPTLADTCWTRWYQMLQEWWKHQCKTPAICHCMWSWRCSQHPYMRPSFIWLQAATSLLLVASHQHALTINKLRVACALVSTTITTHFHYYVSPQLLSYTRALSFRSCLLASYLQLLFNHLMYSGLEKKLCLICCFQVYYDDRPSCIYV